LVAAPAWAQSSTDIERLRNELEALKKEIQLLKEQQAAKPAAAPAAPGKPADAPAEWGDEAPASVGDLKGLRADLENYKYDQARQYERTTAKTTRNTTITGTINVPASYNSPKQPLTTATNEKTQRAWSFDSPSLNLAFNGVLYRDYQEGKNLTYTASVNGSSSIAVQDAFLRYSFAPTNGGPDDSIFNLSFGQQQVPFGLEAQANTEIRPVINGAQFLSAPVNSAVSTADQQGRLLGSNSFGTRQIGLVLRGDYEPSVDRTTNYRSALLEYAAGILNGNGPNASDNNGKKDIVARLAFTLPADYNSLWRELKIGTSYYKGYSNLNNTAATPVTVQNGDSVRYGLDINYTRLPWSVAYERVEGRNDALANPTTAVLGNAPIVKTKAVGQYINIGYTVGEQFLASSRQLGKFDDFWPKTVQYFVRYDTIDFDTADNSAASLGDKSYVTTFGVNAYFAETTRFQVNYLLTRNDAPLGGVYTNARPKDTKSLILRFVYGF
jgi:phosphate-selective porin